MSKVFNMVGGGGGPYASIFVTGLSETDTVTATNGSKTLTGKWAQKPNPAAHGLPDGYMKLEYIESTGTQYIDTGIQNNGLIDFSVTFEQTGWENQSDKQAIVLGSNDSWSGSATDHINMLWITGNSGDNPASGIYLAYNDDKFYKFSDTTIGKKYSMEKSDGVLRVDGVNVETYTPTSFSITPKIHLFCGYQQILSSTTYKFIGKVYNCKIWDENNNLVLDFIPCKNSSGEVGMYDLVTDTFFTNAGTGTFAAGPEIPQTIGGFMIKPIRDFGTWTVTATNGEKTATQDVMVDVITEYEIEMDYKLWLYRDGGECEDISGGWDGTSYFNGINVIGFKTKNNIDLSKYTKLHILLSSYNKANTQGRYCVFVNKANVNPVNADWYYLDESIAALYDTEVVHDISSATAIGNLYIGTCGGSSDYTNSNAYSKQDGYLQATLANVDRTVKIYRIWLE